MRLLILTGALLWALPAAAEDPLKDSLAPIFRDMQDIAPAEWRGMVAGRTVTYQIGGEYWASETYNPNTNGVAILLADGTCMDGVWYNQDREYCFNWSRGDISCFRHVRTGEEILIIPMADGQPSGSIQTVSDISDAPVACGPALTS